MKDIYSNFDHEFEIGAIEYARANPGIEMAHTAYNFFNRITFEDDKFKAKVMRFGNLVAEFENEDIIELIEKVNDTFGYD